MYSDFLTVVLCSEGTQQQGLAVLCQLLRFPLHLVVLYLADPVLPLQDHAPSDLNAASMVTLLQEVSLGRTWALHGQVPSNAISSLALASMVHRKKRAFYEYRMTNRFKFYLHRVYVHLRYAYDIANLNFTPAYVY